MKYCDLTCRDAHVCIAHTVIASARIPQGWCGTMRGLFCPDEIQEVVAILGFPALKTPKASNCTAVVQVYVV